jgi:hypothetical protein
VRLGFIPAEDSDKWKAAHLGATATLNAEQVRQLHTDLTAAAADAKQAVRESDKAWASGKAPTDPKLLGTEPIAAGRVDNDWTDLQWSVFVDDSGSWQLNFGPADEAQADGSVFDPGGTRTLLARLEKLLAELNAADEGSVHAAAGVDTHPGGEQLKHYWLYGEGVAKWSTWTELFHHLRKYLAEGMAKRTAAAWFHLRYGYWPGDHRNVHASAELTDDEEGDWQEGIEALLTALAELDGEVRAAFDPGKHPRGPGGRFRSTVDKLKSAIESHRAGNGKGDPFDGFDREQLRRAAKTRGISLGRGEDRDSIAKKLLADLGGEPAKAPELKTPQKKAPAKRAPRKQAEPPAAEEQPAKKAPPRKPKPAATPAYDGPSFKYSSARKQRLAEELVALKAEDLSGGYDYDRSVRISELEDEAKLSDVEYNRVYQLAQIAANTERWRKAKAPDMSLGELQADMERRSKETLAGKPVAVRVTPAALSGILEGGRFKSQFETNRSNGLLDKGRRAEMERRWFGLAANTDPARRPIYGYVAVGGVRSGDGALDQYGGIQVVLKDGVKSRTTATWGDSLNIPDYTIPEPLDGMTWRSYALPTAGIGNGELKKLDRDVDSPDWREHNYVEAQIHGGVSVSDIAEVVLDKAPGRALRDLLERSGVSWRVL